MGSHDADDAADAARVGQLNQRRVWVYFDLMCPFLTFWALYWKKVVGRI